MSFMNESQPETKPTHSRGAYRNLISFPVLTLVVS